jgi:predicted AAA+ superfamily ATPase
MDKLYQYSALRISDVSTKFKRYLWDRVNWDNRLIVITGARGIGKTTFLLQYIKEKLGKVSDEVIYVSLDDLYFSKNTIVDFAGEFVKRGGKYLFLDEIHKYPDWSQEIKNIYDYFGSLHIIITGSSALDIYKGKADLSRRAISYKMQGLSFREFILLKYGHRLPILSIKDIFKDAPNFIAVIHEKIKPIKLFEEYLKIGYYPFFVEGEQDFHHRLSQTVNHVLDGDLPSVERIDFIAVQNLRKLMSIITEIAPFKPNILKLSKQIGVSRETLQKYLYMVTKADLLMMLH